MGLVEMTRPESPTAKNQKYRLTVRGRYLGQHSKPIGKLFNKSVDINFSEHYIEFSNFVE